MIYYLLEEVTGECTHARTHTDTHTMRRTTQRDLGDRGEVESGVKGVQGGSKGLTGAVYGKHGSPLPKSVSWEARRRAFTQGNQADKITCQLN